MDMGHHQASGVVTLEAFRAAGDASQFPEHLAAHLRSTELKQHKRKTRG